MQILKTFFYLNIGAVGLALKERLKTNSEMAYYVLIGIFFSVAVSNNSNYKVLTVFFAIKYRAPNKRWTQINAGSTRLNFLIHTFFVSVKSGAGLIILVKRKRFTFTSVICM